MCRVYARDPELVAKACDSVYGGVVLPYVEDVEELRRCVLRAKYRPLNGAAAARFLEGGGMPSEKTASYIAAKNRDIFLAAMIESVDAVNNLDDICGAEGVDAVFVGPNDLTVSMGIPEERDNPEFVEVMQLIIDTAGRHGIPAGGHFSNPRHTRRQIEQGARFVPHSSDVRTIEFGFPESVAAALGGEVKRGEERVI